MTSTPFKLAAVALLASSCAFLRPSNGALGTFTGQTDIGAVSRPGTAVYDSSQGTYTVGASGANMWFKADAMHYVWKKESGDLSIAADIAFVGTSAQGHRKACLVIRQSLDPDSAYVDVAVHGDGLASLQYRSARGAVTKEIRSMVSNPSRVRLDKLGGAVYLSVAAAGDKPVPSGASIPLHFDEPFYVGLAVCAHDNAAFETAVFSNVRLARASSDAAVLQPGLRIITLPSGDQAVTDR